MPYRYRCAGFAGLIHVIFTLIIYLFFTKGGAVLLRLGPVTIEEAGLTQGAFIVGRLIALVLASILVTLTTTPLALTHGLEFFLTPLKIIRVPVTEIAMIMTIALRFIPTLMEESRRLMLAQIFAAPILKRQSLPQGAQSHPVNRAALCERLPPRRRTGCGHGSARLPHQGSAHPHARRNR